MQAQLFDEKVKEFEKSLTDEKLKQLPTFTALEGQVAEAVKGEVEFGKLQKNGYRWLDCK